MRELPRKHIYRIIVTNRSRQVDEVFMAPNEQEAYEKYHELLEKSSRVRFPVRYNNNASEIIPSEYELMIIKVREEGEDKVSLIMDDTGRFVECSSNHDDWIIVDRAPYKIEETFFVYGHHPRYDRKDFKWICDNLLFKEGQNKYYFTTVRTYLNKILIEDGNDMQIVICKNKHDCSRLYVAICNEVEERKSKNIALMGDIGKSKYKREWIDKIMKKTGWNRKKVSRNSTRP